MSVLARKPAPVQITFAGYPSGTGLFAMDWRLTDPYLDPPGQTDADYVERSYRLPDCFWCFEPQDDIPVEPAPADRPLTFGCLTNYSRCNEPLLQKWARVLCAVPGSRLLLLTPTGQTRRRALETFQQAGVDPDRVEFVDFQPHPRYMECYRNIDIVLDTLPYNGHTVVLEALWMGCPVVTQVGRTAVGRAGWSFLSNLGLTELAARDDDHFVKIASELAADRPRLAELRRTLRERMLASPLTDSRRWTRNIEAAYQDIWRQWA
jgi:predicted O-linked N-acetylglucosamine transferase (SPINDLY family)